MNLQHSIRVSVDVGCHRHSVAIGLSSGALLDEFDIDHNRTGFKDFFARIEQQRQQHGGAVEVAMEGYNGYARPLDSMVRAHDYKLFNINNLKLARFKEIFPAAAKTDSIDARKGLELFQLRDHLPVARDVLQLVKGVPEENVILKRLTRRRRVLVEERARILDRMQADLQAECPGILEITSSADNVWFLNFLTSSKDLTKLSRLRHSTLLKVPAVGQRFAAAIECWQAQATFGAEIAWVSPMIIEDAAAILSLRAKIKSLEGQCEHLQSESAIAGHIASMPGFGLVCSTELAGEIGTIERFAKEASLAMYLGMAPLDNSSGKYRGSKTPRHVNTRAKKAMMIAVDRHRKNVEQSKEYYDRKRTQGMKHNQAIRALGRHLCRVIYKMLTENRDYEIKVSN